MSLASFREPRERVRTERESEIEQQAMDYAEFRGWWQIKIMRASRNGVPDRLLIRRGRVIFIEFKREDELPDRQQLRRHAEIRAQGIEVFVCDNLADAKRILR